MFGRIGGCTGVTGFVVLRISLVTAGLYGNPEESLALNLRRAFRDFEVWRKARKLQCTQGVWTPGLVACSWHQLAHIFQISI